jgi:AraC family transcriptional regulator, positive regulator of tynA and feaB
MLQSDYIRTPLLDFEASRALLQSNCGGEVEVTAPNVFAGWMRQLNACGLAAAAVKIQWGSAAGDLGCFAHRVERTYRHVRLDSADHYLVVFQVAGQTALTQVDQAVHSLWAMLHSSMRPGPRHISLAIEARSG